jgi:glycosyltransferase involved in cell wall biosynthesis
MLEKVEVRVPTYKRPEMLRRAIQSLVNQSHSNFEAFIFDDSIDGEAQSIVSSFSDGRLLYQRNATNLGCAKSLDKSFSTRPYGDAEFLFVLEDDNVLLPTFIEENVECLKSTGLRIVQRNQESWFHSKTDDYRPLGNTTLAGIWQEGTVSMLRLAAMLFCHVPISNGGLFWRSDVTSDLVVGDSVKDGALQEFARTSQVREDLYCAMKPLAKYTVMDSTTRGAVPYMQAAVFMQSLRRRLYANHGNRLLEEAFQYAKLNSFVRPEKWIAQDLGIFAGVRLLPYWLKGKWISIRGKNPYPEYFKAEKF